MRAISQGKNEGKRARGQEGKRARGQEGKNHKLLISQNKLVESFIELLEQLQEYVFPFHLQDY